MKAEYKKGITLAEMCVVIALVAIIATMVTSFSISVSWRTQLSAARLELAAELDSLETFTGGWLGQMKLQNAALTVQENGVKAGEWTLTFDDGVLNGTLPNENSFSFATVCIKEMEFSLVADEMLFCTVKYDMPGLPEEQAEREQIFCVYPRLGSAYGGAGS